MEAKLTASQKRALRRALDELGATDVEIDDERIGSGALRRRIGAKTLTVGFFFRFEGAWSVGLGPGKGGGFRESLRGGEREPPASVLSKLARSMKAPFEELGPEPDELIALISGRLAALTALAGGRRPPKKAGHMWIAGDPSAEGFAWSTLASLDTRKELERRYRAALRAMSTLLSASPEKSGARRKLPWATFAHAGGSALLWASDHDPGNGLQVYLAFSPRRRSKGPPW